MTPYVLDASAWQESWDRQQEAYLPDREHRIAAMLDVVAAVAPDAPRVLDLAGGTGSITLRALARFPTAVPTVVDQDPVLLAIAEASLGDRATVVSADLNDPAWVDAVPHAPYDAVLTATALHWFQPERLTVLFAEIRSVLRPGGVFINADHMPEESLPGLNARIEEWARARRDARYATGARLSWQAWWDRVALDPALAPLAEKRKEIYPGGHSAEWHPPSEWHADALHKAGFSEAGVIWRGGPDAAVAALA